MLRLFCSLVDRGFNTPDWNDLFDPDAPPQTQHSIRADG
jgi:hypothetical protein